MSNTAHAIQITDSCPVIDYTIYSKVLVMFSGGKDSLACLLHLIEDGCPIEKMELWHHDIDGGIIEGKRESTLMDWSVTRSYCQAVAKAFNIPIYFSWRVGGFEREMNRNNQKTAPVMFETPTGTFMAGGLRGKESTRRKFPQVSADLSVRWCSAYLKIDVASLAINNQKRFVGQKTLVVTGERAEESSARAKYEVFEPHKNDARSAKKEDCRRHIDHYRPVHSFSEKKVWDLIERHRINPHPAYLLGWGRVSCSACIFGNKDQWASIRKISPEQFEKIAKYEEDFGTTIQRKKSVRDLAEAGTPYETMTEENVTLAMSEEYNQKIILDEGEWKLPPGAFGDACGPT